MRFQIYSLFALILLPVFLFADSLWYEDYDAALQAMTAQKWASAEQKLNDAMRKQPNSARKIKIYGSRFIKYVPNYQLALVYFYEGRYSDARLQFQKVDQQRVLNSGDPEFAQMSELKKLITEKLDNKAKPETVKSSEDVATSADSRNQQIPDLVDQAQQSLDRNDFTQAQKVIDALAIIDPDNQKLPGLQSLLAEKRKSAQKLAMQNDQIRENELTMEAADQARSQGEFSRAESLAQQAEQNGFDRRRLAVFRKQLKADQTKKALLDAVDQKDWSKAENLSANLAAIAPKDLDLPRILKLIAQSRIDEIKILQQNALRAYYSGTYEEAVRLFGNILQRKPKSVLAHFYLGCAYAALGMSSNPDQSDYSEKAVAEFRIVHQSNSAIVQKVAYISPSILEIFQKTH
jgi:TolA-binding protein